MRLLLVDADAMVLVLSWLPRVDLEAFSAASRELYRLASDDRLWEPFFRELPTWRRCGAELPASAQAGWSFRALVRAVATICPRCAAGPTLAPRGAWWATHAGLERARRGMEEVLQPSADQAEWILRARRERDCCALRLAVWLSPPHIDGDRGDHVAIARWWGREATGMLGDDDVGGSLRLLSSRTHGQWELLPTAQPSVGTCSTLPSSSAATGSTATTGSTGPHDQPPAVSVRIEPAQWRLLERWCAMLPAGGGGDASCEGRTPSPSLAARLQFEVSSAPEGACSSP